MQKVRFAKRQSFYNGVAGVVFVMDSEGITQVLSELTHGRDAELPDFPMAVGMAHPCIEAWLVADASAMQKGLSLAAPPTAVTEPERIPAPQANRGHNPKTELNLLCGATAAAQKEKIAAAIAELDVLRQRCPIGFAPFAAEIEQRIRPLFQ